MGKLSPRHEIIEHLIAGQAIRQRTRDTYIDARALCDAAGKSFDHYTEQKRNQEFLKALSAQMGVPIRPKPGIPGFALIQGVRGGGNPFLRGTWVHPRVAIHLAQWLSVEFQVWVTGVIEGWERMQRLLRPVPMDWTKRFPDKLYEEIYRLRRWTWHGRSVNPPQVVGHYTNDLVWDRLVAPGFRQAIELRIPRLSSGEHAVRMHQMLVDHVGIPELQQHIGILLTLMDRQETWGGFMFAVDQVLPKVCRYMPPPKMEAPGQGAFSF